MDTTAIRNTTRKAIIPLDSTKKATKMNITKSTNSMIAKRRKVIIRNMAANMNSTNTRKATTRKARNMIRATMKDTTVRLRLEIVLMQSIDAK